MERYITSTQLKQQLRQAKEYARDDVVHILEHGRAAYVLCSLEVYERCLAEARARAIWTVDVEESAWESEEDVRKNRLHALAELGIRVHSTRRAYITASAKREMDTCATSDNYHIVAHMIDELVSRPQMGIEVEYGLRKVLAPPFDLLYSYDENRDEILVSGIIRSLPQRQSPQP